jgi:sterol-4alpha-carboxylate 3-dehydrogenase (decarboxylating)
VKKGKDYKILITGGSGFIGRACVKEFLDPHSLLSAKEIIVYDTEKYTGQNDHRITFVSGNVCNFESLKKATKNIDIVIHAAAIVDWGTHTESEVFEVNYKGTENVIKACKTNKVKILIFTSSLDAVYTGRPLVDIDERQPYPNIHQNMYCESKALSEVAVVKANSDNLKTCVLRPSDVYGEGDPYHIDSLINMAKMGVYVRLGNGSAKCQHVYVGNMAHAHLQVARSLLENNKKVEGSIYFITDGPGDNFFTFFDQIVRGAGYRIWPKNLWLPRWLAYTIGSISELIAFLFRPIKHFNPKFSRFAVTYTCTDFTFSSDKAKNDFGYKPKYGEEEAMERTIAHYRTDRINR